MKYIFLKEKYLRYVLEGKKSLEGRVGYEDIRRFKVGDYVYLNEEYKAQITNIWEYGTFEKAVSEKNYKLLIPDASSVGEAIKIYNSIYPIWKQKEFGVYIFEVKYPV